MNIICRSLYYQYILDTFHLLKSPKTFRVIITIILCCPCYMPKYVPRLEGIMHSPSGRGLCLLTLGHISAYNMDNTIYCINNMHYTFTPNETNDSKDETNIVFLRKS